MTEVLHSPSSSSSTSISTPTHSAAFFNQTHSVVGDEGISRLTVGDLEEEEENSVREKRENDRRDQLSLLALLVTLFRKGFWLARKTERHIFSGTVGGAMEIGWPTDVQHVNHVTFDRFDGFLGLPVEFEPEVPRRPPSASAEGIFRITAGNSQEEFVRDQLNRGVVPEGIDVHCLAGLIKAWFRELPRGLLDSLSSEQVMQCQSEDDCDALVRLLPPTESALLDWAINLMADIVQEEHLNKMNARNIAMVFAPNMTQVQVMNFLKTLIGKTLREREDSLKEPPSMIPHVDPSDDNDSPVHQENHDEKSDEETTTQPYLAEDPGSDFGSGTNRLDNAISDEDYYLSYPTSSEESDGSGSSGTPARMYKAAYPKITNGVRDQFEEYAGGKMVRSNDLASKTDYAGRGISNLSRINSMTERCEAWR
ncbi:Rho GTPase-activating protein 1 [Orobanche minor]